MPFPYPASNVAESRDLGRPVSLTLPAFIAGVLEGQGERVRAACEAFKGMCAPGASNLFTGSDVGARMAERLGHGATVERAAAREYAYRWALALRSPRAFPPPHALGM